jgi:hypothetical protein
MSIDTTYFILAIKGKMSTVRPGVTMICTKCNLDKSESEFCKTSKWCRDCRTSYHRNWVKTHPEKSREYRLSPAFQKRQREYYRGWYAQQGRNRALDYQCVILSWRASHPEAVSAKTKLNYCLRSGTIRRPDSCESCGRSNARLSAHHEDYRKPFKVQWLCSSCHKLKHTRSESHTDS